MNSYYTVHIYIYLENNILTERVGIRILTCVIPSLTRSCSLTRLKKVTILQIK